MRKTGSSRAAVACAGAALAIACAGPALAQKSGPYHQLSPGNQMIAKSLFRAQADAAPKSPPKSRWSLDRISTAKSKVSGWGQVFRKMQAEGLVSADSLGQVVSRYHKPSAWGEIGRSYSGSVVITTGFNDHYLARQGRR